MNVHRCCCRLQRSLAQPSWETEFLHNPSFSLTLSVTGQKFSPMFNHGNDCLRKGIAPTAVTLVVSKMGILAQFSSQINQKMTENNQNFNPQNCIKRTNKIPEYAREYKREYQYIIGINKEFKYIKDFMDNPCDNFNSNKLDRIMKFIKRFLKAQKNGRLKDISNFEFEYFHIENLYEIKKDINYYYSIIQVYYDWSRGLNDESLVSRYEIYKHDLELFFSKLNIEIEDTDDDSCDDSCDDDYDIVFPDSDSDIEELDLSYTDSDLEDFISIVESIVSDSDSDSDSYNDSDSDSDLF